MREREMVLWQAVLLFVCLCSRGLLAQNIDTNVCIETTRTETLPPMPSNFHAFMSSVSVKGKEQQLGHMTISEDTAGSGRASVYYKAAGAAAAFRVIFDQTAGQMMVVNVDASPYVVDNCQVMNATINDATLMTRFTFNGVEQVIPTGKFLSGGSGLKIVKETEQQVNGITATPFRTCHYATAMQATMEVTWWYPANSQTPMQVRARYKIDRSSVLIDTNYTLSPLHSIPTKQAVENNMFMAPRGVYCKGLKTNKLPPMLSQRFSLKAEEFTTNLRGLPPERQPYRLRESYDQRANVSMLEGSGLELGGARQKYGYGTVARINDFTRGISYVKNIAMENCTYEKIPDSGWDTEQSLAGPRIKSPDEFYFPSRSQLQYKGSGVYRSTDVDVYIGFNDDLLGTGGQNRLSVATEYYVKTTTAKDETGETIQVSMPLAIYSASNSNFTSTTDVFDIDTGVPRAYEHDISVCYGATDVQHFELIMSTSELSDRYVRFLDLHRNEFMYALVNSFAKSVNISPLRIFQPKVSLFAAPLVLVEVTIGERVTVPGYTPAVPETPLSGVATAMNSLVASGGLKADIALSGLILSVPVRGFVSLDARGGSSSGGSQGMSSGAVAGLCIGMILLGILIAVGVIAAMGYFRRGDAMFGFTAFGGNSEAV